MAKSSGSVPRPPIIVTNVSPNVTLARKLELFGAPGAGGVMGAGRFSGRGFSTPSRSTGRVVKR